LVIQIFHALGNAGGVLLSGRGEVLTQIQQRNRIASLRAARGLSVKQLAELANLPIGTIVAAEMVQRQPRYDTARRIAGALGVDVSEVYT
jgi:DNA-binding XRE family transcriptional regulator